MFDDDEDLYFKPKQLDESKLMYLDLEPGSLAGDVCDRGDFSAIGDLSGEDEASEFL